jgi:simple sugar transport system ATP-binding protein
MVYQHFMLVDTLTVARTSSSGCRAGFVLNAARPSGSWRAAARYGLEVEPDAQCGSCRSASSSGSRSCAALPGRRILVFDEPTAVLTPQEADGLIATLRRMAANGYCIVFISHKLDEVLAVADRSPSSAAGRPSRPSTPPRRTARAGADDGRAARPRGAVRRRSTGCWAAGAGVDGLRADSDRGAHALNGVSLTVAAGETLGIAGVAGNGQRELAEVVTGPPQEHRREGRVGGPT